MRRNIYTIAIFCVFGLILPATLAARPVAENTKDDTNQVQISHNQRELGAIILEDPTITDGKIKFRTPTGGCTNKGSFTVDVRKENGLSERSAHYVLTIKRIQIDDCKALFPEGTVIEIDLEKDLGLKGDYTVSITNLISPKANKLY